jgi:hypothetical protein
LGILSPQIKEAFSGNNVFCLNQSIFQALKEALEVFCNKTIAGSSSAELLSSFCDNILKKGGSEKMSDEAIEETLEKVAFDHLCFLHRILHQYCVAKVV